MSTQKECVRTAMLVEFDFTSTSSSVNVIYTNPADVPHGVLRIKDKSNGVYIVNVSGLAPNEIYSINLNFGEYLVEYGAIGSLVTEDIAICNSTTANIPPSTFP